MIFDFDQVIDRRGTGSEKWQRYAGRDVIPLWVADMDFAAPPAVLDALRQRLEHGVLGYTAPFESVTAAVVEMLAREYAWAVEPEWLVWTPGLVVALNLACRLVDTDGAVLTHTPIYPPFISAPRFTGHNLRTESLVESGARYEMDFERLDAALADPTQLFLFCHPQNPTGRVWSRAELERVAECCLRHDVLVCSDEVHNGLILDAGKRHIPLATVVPEFAAKTITLMSPSKTFNLPGLMTAFAIIPDPKLRKRFQQVARGVVTELNLFGYVACEAAYRHGEPWRAALVDYLRGNQTHVAEAVQRMPGLRLIPGEATYLAWIDCRAAKLDHPAEFFEQAGVGLSDGAWFGSPGFVRLNFGCPRATLREGLARMERALIQKSQ